MQQDEGLSGDFDGRQHGPCEPACAGGEYHEDEPDDLAHNALSLDDEIGERELTIVMRHAQEDAQMREGGIVSRIVEPRTPRPGN